MRITIAQQDIAGALVRVRWTVADEDRHEVDRALIERELGRAAEVKLEGRIVPVVRTRAAGISRAASLADKGRQWALVTQAKPGPLLACLAQLEAERGEDIAERVLRGELPHARERAAPLLVETACVSDWANETEQLDGGALHGARRTFAVHGAGRPSDRSA